MALIAARHSNNPEVLKILAEIGDSQSQALLGDLYMDGRRVKQDDWEAMKWYRMAADQGDKLAEQKYSTLDERLNATFKETKCSITVEGSHFSYDPPPENITYLAENGSSNAMEELAEMYMNGMGVKQDYSEAYFWAMQAMNYSHLPNMQNSCAILSLLNKAARHLTLSEIASLQPRLRAWESTEAHQKLATRPICLSYEGETTLVGKISEITFPGPPNYESIATGDRAEDDLFITLPTPVCVDADSNEKKKGMNVAIAKTNDIQIVGDPKAYRDIIKMGGHTVQISGKLFGAWDAHHHRPLLISVDAVSLHK